MAYSTAALVEIIRAAARRYGIDENIGIRQLAQESANFTSRYVYGPGTSSAGAMGMAQFMPGTWARYGGGGSPWDPVAAADAWGRYMRDLLNMFNGRYDLALAGYNWGENRATLRQALSTGRNILEFSGIPSETYNYVKKILGTATSLPSYVASAIDSNPSTEYRDSPIAEGNWLSDIGVEAIAGVFLLGLGLIVILDD